jgi:hypothetical protein
MGGIDLVGPKYVFSAFPERMCLCNPAYYKISTQEETILLEISQRPSPYNILPTSIAVNRPDEHNNYFIEKPIIATIRRQYKYTFTEAEAK